EVIDFEPEVERTLRKIRKKAKQKTQDHFIEEVVQNTMAVEANNPTKTLMDYTIPSTASCGSSIVRPNIDANNFELKPALIQLVQ
ncbi:hypothetical protein PIB30_106918, partial [Stylosanthes scabra]|nr:hypothetical protein [Stylosanthes scabra]